MQSLDVISVNIWQMAASLANLVLLFLIVKKFLYKPVKNMLRQRREAIDRDYSDANEAKEQALSDKAAYEEKLSHAKEESEEILKNAVRRAQLREEEILREANNKAARVMKRAEEQVEMEKKRAINEVKDEVSDMAIGIASAVLERDISPEEHETLIDEFIRTMGDA